MRDGFSCIGTKVAFAMAIRTILGMINGVDAILVEAIDLSQLARHLVMPTSKFCTFGFEIAHFE